MVLALRAGQLDVVVQMSPQQARAFKNNSRYRVYTVPVSSHNMFGMRVDRDPFRDARVRRAVALTLNRPDLINRILLGAGALGNDSPFFSGFPSTDPSIKQRKQNLELARALLRAAGKEDLKFTITTHNQFDVPDYAAAIQAAGRQAGITIDLDVMTYDDYYAAVGGGDYDDDDAVAERDRDDHRVRRTRGAERLHDGRVHDERHLERVEVRERSVRRGGADVPRLGRGRGAAEGDKEDGGIPPA